MMIIIIIITFKVAIKPVLHNNYPVKYTIEVIAIKIEAKYNNKNGAKAIR